MGWYRDIQSILQQEPETWLAYLYGQQLENIPHLTQGRPRIRGLFMQLGKVMLQQLRHMQVWQHGVSDTPVSYVAFAGTLNQKHSLDTTLSGLRQRGESVVAIGPKSLINCQSDNQQYVLLKYSLSDIGKAIFLLLRRGPALYRELRSVNPVAINWYFADFCSVYVYLCYFRRLIRQLEPEFVITANDHNPPNRCLLAVAHSLSIRTVYLQHASVSRLFPALRVNYAFLDGQSALDTYRECEQNQPAISRNVPLPKVLLTGQKKHLNRARIGEPRAIGIALNALDDADQVIELVKTLAAAGHQMRVRWHPNQADQYTRKYASVLSDFQLVSLSHAEAEAVSDFMAGIGSLVAGNSSIHLEAALAGVVPIYYEFTRSDSLDYYGYVKNGVAKWAQSPEEIIQLVRESAGTYEPDTEAVRYYSATYLTEWDGKEGELVAECLSRILRGEACPVSILEV